MSRVNIYLADDLAAAARADHLNVSSIAAAAIRDQLAVRRADRWLASLRQLRTGPAVDHDAVLDVLRAGTSRG